MEILVSAVEANPPGAAAARRYRRSMRLRRHADFVRVYREGRRHFARHMTVYYLPRPQAGSSRVGYTVSRFLGGAVDRNRIKRRLREAVRLAWPRMGGAVDLVVNPKKSLLKAPFEDLVEEVGRVFEIIRQREKQ